LISQRETLISQSKTLLSQRDYLDIPEGNPAIPEELLRKSFWIKFIQQGI
jgi:hypothetical protein